MIEMLIRFQPLCKGGWGGAFADNYVLTKPRRESVRRIELFFVDKLYHLIVTVYNTVKLLSPLNKH